MLQTEIWRAVNYFLTLISQTGRNVSQLQGFHFEVSGTIQLTLMLFLTRKWFQIFQVSGASIVPDNCAKINTTTSCRRFWAST